MKTRPACAAVVSLGTSLLMLAGIRCTQAAAIKVVSPSAYEDTEGEGSIDENCCSPFHAQQVFPSEDFAALGDKPHWLVDITFRPDQGVTSPRTVHDPDSEIRLTTMPPGPPNLSLRFDDNLGSNFKHWYSGPLTLVADVDGSDPVPREFYNAERPAGVNPYLYDPSQGNLLFDVFSWQGLSPSHRGDRTTSMQTALASNPFATDGERSPAASIFQFTFLPVTPGDYNQNGTVDAADNVVWRSGLGTTYSQDDYDAWRANFGRAPSAGWSIGNGAAGYPLGASAEPLSIAVPEVASVLLLIFGATFVAFFRVFEIHHDADAPQNPVNVC